MKEIDFLPEWYKNSRRRQFGYRTQYVALAGILAVMFAWNFTTAHSISKARAEIAQLQTQKAQADVTSAQLDKIKNQLTGFQKKLKSVEQIDSRIDIAAVLAEMSFLIDEKIVLGKLQFIAEKVEDSSPEIPNTNFAVRVASLANKQAPPLGDVRFKIVITGVAADAGDVAALICRLEDSPYFYQVIPSYSRNKPIKPATEQTEKTPDPKKGLQKPKESFQASEFEISCYLANYQQP